MSRSFVTDCVFFVFRAGAHKPAAGSSSAATNDLEAVAPVFFKAGVDQSQERPVALAAKYQQTFSQMARALSRNSQTTNDLKAAGSSSTAPNDLEAVAPGFFVAKVGFSAVICFLARARLM